MKIQEYLKQQGTAFEVHEHTPAYTAQELAAAEHVSGDMLAKPVVVNADGKYAICVLPASYKLDLDKVGAVMKASDVRLADEREMVKLFPDADVGAEPPFGNLYDLPTLVDQHIADDQEIVFQAGTHCHTIQMKYDDYAALAEPVVADIAMHL